LVSFVFLAIVITGEVLIHVCYKESNQHLFLQHFSIENNEQHAAASTSKQQLTLS